MKRIMLVLSVAALTAAMLVASGSPAFAKQLIIGPPDVGGGGGEIPLTKEACKDGGFQAVGYRNQGQCVKAANHGASVPGDDGSDISDPGGGVIFE